MTGTIFSRSGPVVQARAQPSARAGAVAIEVVDTGPGIPAADRARVVERFYRADAARGTADGGSGLGLAIARWTVDLHGGSIGSLANSPTGCKMRVELPAP